MLHPYPFKWRIRRFSGLIYTILRHTREIGFLDANISGYADEIIRLRKELDALKRGITGIKEGEGRRKKRARDLEKQIEQKVKRIKRDVNYFCKNARRDLEELRRIKIDSDTLDYREAKYLSHLFRIWLMSKKIEKIGKEEISSIKSRIKEELRSLKGKTEEWELQAKYLERGGVNTVMLSQMSPWGSGWIRGAIRIKAIEVGKLHKRFKEDSPGAFFQDFEREIKDIYEIGKSNGMLIRRLKLVFSSVKSRLSDAGISSHELNKTQRFFEKRLREMEKTSKYLCKEVSQYAN